jgi:hypothetical protein
MSSVPCDGSGAAGLWLPHEADIPIHRTFPRERHDSRVNLIEQETSTAMTLQITSTQLDILNPRLAELDNLLGPLDSVHLHSITSCHAL